MNRLTGKSLIAGSWQADEQQSRFRAYSPLTDTDLEPVYINVSKLEVNQACMEAEKAFYQYCESTKDQRSVLLNTIADEILALGEPLIELTHNETGLPVARLQAERGRTVNQLRYFAELLHAPLLQEQEDHGEPSREPVAKPHTRLGYLPLGPVAVFGASNFPYAFSVAGGDTASALAAGCTVVVKGHPAHPGTSELIAVATTRALAKCGLPQGVFSLLQSTEANTSHALVQHPAIKAIGFTGSLRVAEQLQLSIDKRKVRIPFYAELGSVNPQIILAERAKESGKDVVADLTDSLLMGQGQFCTSPGIWLLPEQHVGLAQHAADYLKTKASAPLLTRGIRSAFNRRQDIIAQQPGVSLLGTSQTSAPHHATAYLYQVSASDFITHSVLREEVFGPSAILVTYRDEAELNTCLAALEGQLTASVHGTDGDLLAYQGLIRTLSHKVGRLIFNQMPTGVEICHAMNHGGPYPASSDIKSTSVGGRALERFVRPICYQNMPLHLFR